MRWTVVFLVLVPLHSGGPARAADRARVDRTQKSFELKTRLGTGQVELEREERTRRGPRSLTSKAKLVIQRDRHQLVHERTHNREGGFATEELRATLKQGGSPVAARKELRSFGPDGRAARVDLWSDGPRAAGGTFERSVVGTEAGARHATRRYDVPGQGSFTFRRVRGPNGVVRIERRLPGGSEVRTLQLAPRTVADDPLYDRPARRSQLAPTLP